MAGEFVGAPLTQCQGEGLGEKPMPAVLLLGNKTRRRGVVQVVEACQQLEHRDSSCHM